MTFNKAAESIIEQRSAKLAAAEALFLNALKQSPELLRVETALRALSLADALGKPSDTHRKAELEAQKRTLLDEMGLTDKALHPKPACRKCGDTARTSSGYCDCVKSLAINDKKNLEIPLHSFQESAFEKMDEAHRERNQAVYDDVQKICARYPDNTRRVITIFGSTGTGKTWLAGCVCNAMLTRGFAVTAVTAFGIVNRALKYHTTFDHDKYVHLEPLLESDLLVIDDLGNESVLKNITHEYLYIILSERLNAGRLTLITTNLTQEGLLARYGERIYSRLFDKRLGYANILNGKDLRFDGR